LVNGVRGSGGLERVLIHKASYLAEKYGYTIRVLVLNEELGPTFYPLSPLVEIVRFQAIGRGVKYLLQYVRGVREELSKFNPDVLAVCDDGLKGVLLPLFLPRRRSALIYERHASIQLSSSWWQRLLMRWTAPRYDKFVVLTTGGAAEWPRAHVKVIPNPLPEFTQPSGDVFVSRQPVILCVGSLSHNKGYDLLIDAWAQIAEQHPGWQIQVYGKGDPTPFQKHARELGIGDNINFLAPIKDIASKYREAAFLVLPSRSEGFGMVLIEAMSCGMPCISFDCPSGPGDIINNGIDGVLVPAENVNALAQAMSNFINNPSQRERFGEAARATAKRYDIDKIAAEWNALFSSLLIQHD